MSEGRDKAFEEYLGGGSRLSAVYREVQGEEPSAELDEIVTEAARREVRLGPKVAYSPFTRSWRWPLALAAILVVSVTVTFVIHEQTGEPLPAAMRPMTDGAPSPATGSHPAAVGPEPRIESGAGSAPPSARAPERGAGAPEPSPLPPLPGGEGEAGASLPPAGEGSGMRDARAPAAALKKETPAAAPKAGELPSTDRQRAPAVPSVERATPFPAESAAPAAAGARPPAAADVAVPAALPRMEEKAPGAAPGRAAKEAERAMTPEQWLAKIEALRREGKQAEADALLVEFRKRFPDYPLEARPK